MKVVHRIGKVENRLHLNMILENIMTAVCQSVVAGWEWVGRLANIPHICDSVSRSQTGPL